MKIGCLVLIWIITMFMAPMVGTLFLLCILGYLTYTYFYFRSNKFNFIKGSIKIYTDNSNELNHHIQELKCAYVDIKSYDYGSSSLQDMSKYKFKRKEWSSELKNEQIYNCSMQVCKNSQNQPVKYLCKYFNIKIDEDTLINFETVLNDFAAAEQGKKILLKERDSIINSIKNDIPSLILTFSKDRLLNKLGFEEIDLSDLHYPVYIFRYISAGGNSAIDNPIRLDIVTLESLLNYINDLVKFRNSIKGQRALMTTKLREYIKKRDDFTCKCCGISVFTERNLLLEIDHIIPLSKGGITSESNLQTLCWRCNRTKGAKVL